MKMRPSTLLLCLLCGVFLVVACRKDPLWAGPTTPTTPYVVDLPRWVLDSIGPMPVPHDNPLTVEGVALGRQLFYDPILSNDLTMSCATCHVQEHGFSDPRAVSIGTNGESGTRNSMPLINLAWSAQFFWDGRRASLEEQAFDPVTNPIEMANTWPEVERRLRAHPEYPALFSAAFGPGGIDSLRVTKALAQFQRTLVSFNSRFDRAYYGGRMDLLTPEERHGMDLYLGVAKCASCHPLGLTSVPEPRVVGLDVEVVDPGVQGITGSSRDRGRFKVPTLRNIEHSAPYMHDGRFLNLIDNTIFYNGHVQAYSNLDTSLVATAGIRFLTNEDEEAITAFLRSFTDHAFLNDPRHATP